MATNTKRVRSTVYLPDLYLTLCYWLIKSALVHMGHVKYYVTSTFLQKPNCKSNLISTANANLCPNPLLSAEHLIGWSQWISATRTLQTVTKTCYMLLAGLHFIKLEEGGTAGEGMRGRDKVSQQMSSRGGGGENETVDYCREIQTTCYAHLPFFSPYLG